MADKEPPSKRRRVEQQEPSALAASTLHTPLLSLDREITPPPRSNADSTGFDLAPLQEITGTLKSENVEAHPKELATSSLDNTKPLRSPIQLTQIRDLPNSSNLDTVSLKDILSDPLISECWQFNFLFDLDFVMNALDHDVRKLVQVKIVHGSWKADASNRIRVEEAAKQYPNVKVLIAHMPEMMGTHHSKMMMLFRHDGTAQVIIHTANMIPRDWANLCQAVWRSPLLPLLVTPTVNSADSPHPIGTGQRFKDDLLRYLAAYEGRTRGLVEQLKRYDFGSVKAALIASTPSRVHVSGSNAKSETSWGWPGLQEILKAVPVSVTAKKEAQIILQTSSIATLPEKWMTNFLNILAGRNPSVPVSPFAAAAASTGTKARFKIIFPTADEVRRSLDGYEAGASIHTKIQSTAQSQQVNRLKPMLCHWAGDASDKNENLAERRQALRRRAAPHIKTYIRFSSPAQTQVEWALVTSANLSQQAWGCLPDKNGNVRISSYEIGVVVWPDLFGTEVKIVPVFGHDTPSDDQDQEQKMSTEGFDTGTLITQATGQLMGLRMPYDLPLIPYAEYEVPWCASMNHSIPDWKGVVWDGFEEH